MTPALNPVVQVGPFVLVVVAIILLPLFAYRAQRREEAREHEAHGRG